MNRLLRIAELIAGTQARHRVFEPLLADWQGELRTAEGAAARATVIASGAIGFGRALIACSLLEGVWIPPLRGLTLSLAWTSIAITVSAAIMLLAPLPRAVPRDLTEPLVQRYLLTMSTIVLPPVFLLAAYALRRDRRSTLRHAIVITLLVTAATSLLVVNTTEEALRKRYDTFEMSEHLRDLSMARHRAGDAIYAGDRYQRELRSTVAQRRANFDRFQARLAEWSKEAPPTLTQRFAQFRPVMLSVIFSMIGWMLAGLGPVTMARGFGWWALMFVATITVTRILSMLIRLPMPSTPQWLVLPLFAALMLVLALGVHRTKKRSSS